MEKREKLQKNDFIKLKINKYYLPCNGRVWY